MVDFKINYFLLEGFDFIDNILSLIFCPVYWNYLANWLDILMVELIEHLLQILRFRLIHVKFYFLRA